MDPSPGGHCPQLQVSGEGQGQGGAGDWRRLQHRPRVGLCFTLEGATVPHGPPRPDAPADLGYEDNCRCVVEEVASAYGSRIDVLMNNAAGGVAADRRPLRRSRLGRNEI